MSRFSAIYANGAWYVKTDYKSPKGRIMKADPGVDARGLGHDRARSKDVIDDWSIVGGKIYVNRLQ